MNGLYPLDVKVVSEDGRELRVLKAEQYPDHMRLGAYVKITVTDPMPVCEATLDEVMKEWRFGT